MAFSFRINYVKVISQANEISSLADELKSQATALNSQIAEVKSIWEGDAASETLKQMEKMRASILANAQKMDSLASTIRSIALMIQREDEAKAAAAKKLMAGLP